MFFRHSVVLQVTRAFESIVQNQVEKYLYVKFVWNHPHNPFSTPTNLQRDTEQKFVVFDVDVGSSRNSQCEDTACDVFSDVGTNEKKTKYVFGAAKPKVCRHETRKFAVGLLQFLSWS